MENRENETRGRAKTKDDERGLIVSEDIGSSEPANRDEDSPGAATNRDLTVRGLAAVGVAIWCVTVLAIGVNLAESAWEWVWIFGFGTVVPALFLWQVGRLLTSGRKLSPPSAKDKEKELLQALSELGELTPITAAVRTSLTADEAVRMLEGLASKGYLRLRVEDGIQTYALREPDLSEASRRSTTLAGPASNDGHELQPLDDPLSERELEVLVLLASGKTNREIASDLFVTVGTVKSHTSNIYGKLGAKNRTEALARSRELGFLP